MTDLLSIILNVLSPIFLVAGLGFFVAKRWNPDTRIVSLLLVYTTRRRFHAIRAAGVVATATFGASLQQDRFKGNKVSTAYLERHISDRFALDRNVKQG